MRVQAVCWGLFFAFAKTSQAVEPITSPGESVTPTTHKFVPALGLLSLVYSNSGTQTISNNECTCGRTNSETLRIVGGGTVSKVNKYPWMVAIVDGSEQICGGVLITDRHVLTAAHCIVNNIEFLKVILMVHDWSKQEPQRITSRIDWAEKHPSYSNQNDYKINDVAILKLSTILKMSDILSPICMPEILPADKDYAGDEGLALGWGKVSPDGSLSKTLQEAKLKIISNKECKTKINPSSRISDDMLCTYSDGKDFCTGDSGGPLTVKNKDIKTVDVYHVVGIRSWGVGCANKDIPSVNARILPALSWIKSITSDGHYCKTK